jgi:hypothetical protein
MGMSLYHRYKFFTIKYRYYYYSNVLKINEFVSALINTAITACYSIANKEEINNNPTMPRFSIEATEYQLRENGNNLISTYQLQKLVSIIPAQHDEILGEKMKGTEFQRYAQGFVEAVIVFNRSKNFAQEQIPDLIELGAIQLGAMDVIATSPFTITQPSRCGAEEYSAKCRIFLDLYPNAEFK